MKKLLVGLAVILSLAVIVVLVGPGFVDWNRYKSPIENRLSDLFGRPVAIEGPVDFALLPTPILSATGVRVAGLADGDATDGDATDADAAGEPAPMLEIGGLDARVALAPLMGGTVRVERVILIDPVVRVARGPDGETNWRALADSTGGPPADIRLDRVTIENGTLVWRDAASGGERRFREIFAQLSAESLRGPATALGSFAVGEQALTFDLSSGRLSPSGALPVNLTLGVDGADAEFRFAGILARSGRIQGDVRGSGSDLGAALVRLLPVDSVPTATAAPFTLAASVDARREAIALNGVTAELGDSRATGAASLVPGAPWQVDAALSLDRLDLDAWAGPGTAWRLLEAPPALPRGVTARIDATIDAAAWRDGLMRRITLEATLAGGRLDLAGLRGELPGSARLAVAGRLGRPEASAEGGQAGEEDAGNGQAGPWLDLRGEGQAGDLRGLMAWLGIDGSAVPPARLHALEGRARLRAGPRGIRLSSLDATVDSTRVRGNLSLGPAPAPAPGDTPALGARLTIDSLDLDGYLPETAPDTPRDALAWAGEHARDLLARVADRSATVELRAGTLTLAGVDFTDPALVAGLADGALTLGELSWGSALATRARASGRVGALDPLGGLDLSLTGEAETLAPALSAVAPGLDFPAEAAGDVSLNGRLRGDPGALSVDGHLRLAGGEVMVSGAVEGAAADPRVDLTARVAHDEAGRMIALVLPERAPPDGFGPLDLYARLRGDRADLAVEEAQGRLGPVTLSGEGRWRAGDPRDRVEISLRTGDLPIDAFAPVAVPTVPGPAAPRSWRLPALLDGLDAVDGRLALNATALSLGSIRIADTALRAGLDAGVLTVDRMDGRLFGGRLGVTGSLDGAGDQPLFDGRIDLGGADLAETLSATYGADGLDGTLDFRFEGEAAGDHRTALVGSLSGDGLIAARQGRLDGIDLAVLDRGLRRLERPSDFLAVLDSALDGGQTPFDALNVPFTVEAGIASTDRLRLSTPSATGDGRGRMDLVRRRLDLTTELHPASLPAAAPPLGLRLTGAPAMPRRRLETQALQAYVAQRAADALSERYRRRQAPAEAPDEAVPDEATPDDAVEDPAPGDAATPDERSPGGDMQDGDTVEDGAGDADTGVERGRNGADREGGGDGAGATSAPASETPDAAAARGTADGQG
ncbi:MAG: AsmA family protein [Azospirillaceae bacterium]